MHTGWCVWYLSIVAAFEALTTTTVVSKLWCCFWTKTRSFFAGEATWWTENALSSLHRLSWVSSTLYLGPLRMLLLVSVTNCCVSYWSLLLVLLSNYCKITVLGARTINTTYEYCCYIRDCTIILFWLQYCLRMIKSHSVMWAHTSLEATTSVLYVCEALQ